ncbi:hypothetical protein SKM52_03490 [Acinetobacter faecalis]|uniref:DUF7024 domain-containing protein n=1 Tax=Acinetobacter faecalis TaxID=2665161 RepID=UPI002A90A4BC|nr:hypothetical protein [Acinetobacter faecalis]MDY6523612.1 hypothetical protein [Acinetobacter faecalis]
MTNRVKILFGFLIIIFFTLGITKTPIVTGDGHEYSLTTKAFVNHFSPNIQSSDVVDRITEIESHPERYFNEGLFRQIEYSIDSQQDSVHGIFKTKTGEYFGYHYGFYPALVAVVERFLLLVHVNPLAAFQLTNIIFMLLGVFVILKNEESHAIVKSLLFLLGGVIFYWQWTHPEVMAYCCLFLFTYFLFKNKYKKSIVFLALATTQIISFAVLYLFIPAWILINKQDKSLILKLLKDIRVWGVGFLSLSSLFFYYYYFGKFSIIGQSASSIDGINWLHFVSHWFDLDQGVFIGAPWVFIVILISILKNKKIAPDLLFSILIGVLICIPLLTNNNANHGQAVFSRYALYSIAPLVAWSCLNLSSILSKKIYYYILLGVSISYVIYVNKVDSSIFHKPWTQILLNHFPQYYNPYPEIYIERNQNYEGIDKKIYTYLDRNAPLITKKIIFQSGSDLENELQSLCKGNLSLSDGSKILIPELKTVKSIGWTYINTPLKCEGFWFSPPNNTYATDIHHRIDFSQEGYPDFVNHIEGFSENESWGTWLDGKHASINIKGQFKKNMQLKLTMQAFPSLLNQTVIIQVNGIKKEIKINKLEAHDYVLDFTFNEQPHALLIEFLQPNAQSPASLGLSSDPRVLGLGIINLEWYPSSL